MTILPQHLDYTDKDFDSLRVRLRDLARSAFPTWTDFEVANFGNLLLELYAFVGEVLTYYQDNQARECHLATATQRQNVILLAGMLGYRLAGAGAATVDLEFRLSTIPLADVTLPKGTVVRTREIAEPIAFQLLEPVTVAAGIDPPVAMGRAEHSTTHQELFDSSAIAHQELRLTFTPYLDDSASVVAGNGSFEPQDTLLGSGPTDRHFTLTVDQHDRATIRFGDGLQGLIPTGAIQVTYKTGGGSHGNVEAGRLTALQGSFVDAHGHGVSLSVLQPGPASGGAPRQSMASAKRLAPASLRTLSRSVAREDFEQNALRLPEVARALMLTSNEDSTIDENSGILFVVPRGGGTPSQALLDQVLHQVTVVYPSTLTFVVSVQPAIYKTVDLSARVFLRPGFTQGAVRSSIEQSLAQWFAIDQADGTPNDRVGFGFQLRQASEPTGFLAWSTLLQQVASVPGIRKIGDGDLDFLLGHRSDDVAIGHYEFPILGTLSLINGDTGEAF